MHRHRIDTVSLVAGLAFVAVGLLSLAQRHDVIDVDVGLVGPIALIGLGLAALLSGLRREEADDHAESGR